MYIDDDVDLLKINGSIDNMERAMLAAFLGEYMGHAEIEK